MSSVLVVDDEDSLRSMIAELVEDLGHQPLLATNGQEALASLHACSQAPALVIADVMMPRMSGIDLAETIKRDPQLCGIPIVLMSAAGRPSSTRIANHFLPKPFELDVLADLIERYV